MTAIERFEIRPPGLSIEYQFLDLFEDANKVYFKFPFFQKQLRDQFMRIAGESTWQAAHQWLISFRDSYLHLPLFPLNVESGDAEIRESARAMALKCDGLFKREIGAMKDRGASEERRHLLAIRLLQDTCSTLGVVCPLLCRKSGEVKKDEIVAAMARLIEEKWWRGQLRKLHARYLERAARYLGLVCKRRGGYCSGNTLLRRRWQKARNRDLLENMMAENDQGQVYTLAELSDMGVSNPVNRRNELMTRIGGFERLADADDEVEWQAVFITVTCPSKFHSHNRNGIENTKWDQSTPRDAQKYLSKVWSLARSKWDKLGIRRFGVRIAEPHHDGCPHWHFLLWVPADQLELAMDLYRVYSLSMNGDERGADLRRFKYELITNDSGGSAAGYISKYISKNVDGLTTEGDAWSADSVRTAVRVEAWASTWGIRQFQQIGGASVTVWRELRRLDQPEFVELIEEIRRAADDGDWAEYTRLMGGPTVSREDQPLRALMVALKDKLNGYGEEMRRMWGLLHKWGETQTRVREWGIYSGRSIPDLAASAALGAAGETGPPLDLCQ